MPFEASFEVALPGLACSRRTSGMESQQRTLGDDEIGQSEQAEELRLILGQALVAGLLVPEQVLDHMEGMLDLGSPLDLSCSACSSRRAHWCDGSSCLRLPGCMATCHFGPLASSRLPTPR